MHWTCDWLFLNQSQFGALSSTYYPSAKCTRQVHTVPHNLHQGHRKVTAAEI